MYHVSCMVYTLCNRLGEVCPEYKNVSLSFPLFSVTPNQSSTGSDIQLTGPQKMAQNFETLYLGKLPMDPSVLTCGEQGSGLIEVFPDTIAATYLNKIVDQLVVCTEQKLASQQAKMNAMES